MRIPFLPQTGCCQLCGRAVEGFEGAYLCEDCSGAYKPQYDRAGSAFRFELDARRLLLNYKFNCHIWLKDDLTDALEGAARARFEVTAIDVILPMPITTWHRIDRGYNPSAYLAEALSERLDRRFDARVLLRCGHPVRQAGLDEKRRRENVKGTFTVRRPEWIRGRTVLIVDDVMTTGATFSECARVLKAAGARTVWCLSLARSIRT